MLLTHDRRDVKDAVLAKLDQFIFSEDVQLGDVTDTFAQIAVVGPAAAAVVGGDRRAASPSETLRAMPEHGNVRGDVGRRQPAIVTRVDRHGRAGLRSVRRARAGGRARGARWSPPASSSSTPRPPRRSASRRACRCFGRDMDEETIPLEAGIESRAISFTKGCYVGQEVIIRVLHRGHGRVARKLVGLTLDGDAVPAAGARDPQRRSRDRPA